MPRIFADHLHGIEVFAAKNFDSFCVDIELNIHELLTASDKKEQLAYYYTEIEPLINTVIASDEILEKQRDVLREYKQVFRSIEQELNHIMQQEELKRRLEFKLHELLDYSEQLDCEAKAEVQSTRSVIHDLCTILSNPEFDVQKTIHFLQEISTENVSKKYKESYNNIVKEAKSCVDEAQKERTIPPSPLLPS